MSAHASNSAHEEPPSYERDSLEAQLAEIPQRIAEEDEEAERNRLGLQELLEQLKVGRNEEEQATLQTWIDEIFRRLLTPNEVNWNYYPRNSNLRDIHREFGRIHDKYLGKKLLVDIRKLRGGWKYEIPRDLQARKIVNDLKLMTPYDGRLWALNALFINVASRIFPEGSAENWSFARNWSGPFRQAVLANRNNLTDRIRWHRIEAALRFVENTADEVVGDDGRITPRYKPTALVEELDTLPHYGGEQQQPTPTTEINRVSRRWNNFLRRQNSLEDHRRIGIRQLRMRRLEDLGEAKDGGRLF